MIGVLLVADVLDPAKLVSSGRAHGIANRIRKQPAEFGLPFQVAVALLLHPCSAAAARSDSGAWLSCLRPPPAAGSPPRLLKHAVGFRIGQVHLADTLPLIGVDNASGCSLPIRNDVTREIGNKHSLPSHCFAPFAEGKQRR